MYDNIKKSNIKTQFSKDEVRVFVHNNLGGVGDLTKLTEGHISQAFSFKDKKGISKAIRISQSKEGFQKDKFAYDKLSSIQLPMPEIYEIGTFSTNAYFCVSAFVEGVPSDKLSDADMKASLDEQLYCFANIFKHNIQDSKGWGDIIIESGDGVNETWKDGILKEIKNLNEKMITKGLESLNLNPNIFHNLSEQFFSNMDSLPDPKRKLVHGDLGFDNVLVKNGKVVAVLDWNGIGYGDWVFEYARFDFWWPGRYANIKDFGKRFELDCEKLKERTKAGTSFAALTTINWAIEKESKSTLDWLKIYLPQRLQYMVESQ